MPQLPLKSQLKPEVLENLNDCPQCHGKHSHFLFTENEFDYLECSSCSLIYLKTRLKPQHLNLIYDHVAYHDISAGEYHTRNGLKRLRLLPALPKGARIHEDGAGNGSFIYQALQNGYAATGSDFGQDAIKKAKEAYGVELKQGSLEQQGIPQASLDALVSFNLICHLYEPWRYVAYVASLLKPNGLFLLRVGDRSGFFKSFNQGNWGAPEHVYHFNAELLTKMLNQSDMDVVWIKPAFDSDFPYFLFEFSRKNKNILGKIAGKICSISIRLWTLLGLPKDDIYLLAKKRS